MQRRDSESALDNVLSVFGFGRRNSATGTKAVPSSGTAPKPDPAATNAPPAIAVAGAEIFDCEDCQKSYEDRFLWAMPHAEPAEKQASSLTTLAHPLFCHNAGSESV